MPNTYSIDFSNIHNVGDVTSSGIASGGSIELTVADSNSKVNAVITINRQCTFEEFVSLIKSRLLSYDLILLDYNVSKSGNSLVISSKNGADFEFNHDNNFSKGV